MATFSFPNSPSLNQTYTFQGKTWKYNGTGWALVTNVDIAQSAWNTANLAYINSNTADILAQAAYDTANTKFSSTGGTITGNTSIVGNLTVSGNISYTGNVTTTSITGNTGQFFGYSSNGFNAIYAGIPSGYLVEQQMISQFTANYNGYAGVNHQNINNGTLSSVDAFFTPNNGSANDTFLDLGMASSTYSYPGYTIITPNDAYLIAYGNTITGGGNMIVSTGLSNDIIFTTGGVNVENEMARFKNGVGLVLKNMPITFADNTSQNTAAAPYAYSNAAYGLANSTLTYATAGFNKANTANVTAQAAFDFANSVNTYASAAYANGNNTLQYAQSAYAFANAVNTYASAAYANGNNTLQFAQAGFNKANTANVTGQAAFDFANSVNTYAYSAYASGNSTLTYATAAFNLANTGNVLAQAAFNKANGAVQTAFVTVSANGTSITPSSNNDTLTITAATANGINVLNPSSKTIDFGLRTSGVTAGNYGSSTNIPVIAVDAFGRITSASNTSISTSISLSGTTGTGSVSGGGTLTFNSTNGITTSITGSTITINSPQNLQTTATPTFAGLTTTGDVNITGNLTIQGAYTYTNTAIYQSVDSLIELAANNTGDAVDIGFYGLYNNSGNKYAGLARSAGSNFVLFKDLATNPTTNSVGSITLANYGTLRANLTGGVVSGLANTIGIADGGTNNSTYTTGALLQYNGSAIVSLANTGVTAGSYGNTTSIPSITVDAYGRVTSVSNNTIYVPPGTSITANSGQLTANAATGNVAIGLATTSVSAGSYGSSTQIPTFTVDSYGRLTAASNTSISTTISLSGTSGSGSVSGGGTLSFAGSNGVTATVSSSTITISTPQDLETTSSPLFKAATLNTSAYLTSTVYTTSSTSQVTVDSFATTTYRSAKYLVQMTSGSSYHIIELNVLHDGTNPLLAQYGEIFTGSSLGTFDVSITTGTLNLLFTPTNSATTVKLVRTNIVV